MHFRGRVCGVYAPPWESINTASYMGDTWQLAFVTQDILDRQDLISAALITLLFSTSIFTGECADFCHLISNSTINGYLALYHIVRMTHPVLGQTTSQPAQPLQSKTQSFSENVANYTDYFQ
jgi:hypothetical protein